MFLSKDWNSAVFNELIGPTDSHHWCIDHLRVKMFHHSAPQLLTVLGTGFCGGYTTFSTASVESVRLVEQRQWSLALYNTFGTLLGTVGACAAGLELGWVLA